MSNFTDVLSLTHAHSPGSRSGLVYHVQAMRHLTPDAFVMRIDRNEVETTAGQCVTLGVSGSGVNREYSLYSGEHDNYFEFLVKVVEDGQVSNELMHCSPGTQVDFDGPYGQFVLREPENTSLKYLFIATGVGIAPYRSFLRTWPELDYTILHGVRNCADRHEIESYERSRYISCVSREDGGDFRGRVTDYLKQNPVDPSVICYLCGNNEMISETYDLLREQGLNSDQIFTEIFF
jgi:ferredoxin--NADP+ reductase